MQLIDCLLVEVALLLIGLTKISLTKSCLTSRPVTESPLGLWALQSIYFAVIESTIHFYLASAAMLLASYEREI
jgi:hypothetical protein